MAQPRAPRSGAKPLWRPHLARGQHMERAAHHPLHRRRALRRGLRVSPSDAQHHRCAQALSRRHERSTSDDPDARLREAQLIERIRHENVVRVLGAGVDQGPRRPLDGLHRRARLCRTSCARRDAWGRERRRSSAPSSAARSAAVHGAGLIHRDVKAQNVMRQDGGRYVLMDYRRWQEPGATRQLGLGRRHARLHGARGADRWRGDAGLRHLQPRRPAVPPAHRDLPCERGQPQPRSIASSAKGQVRSLRDLRPDVPVKLVRVIEKATAFDRATIATPAPDMMQQALEEEVLSGTRLRAPTSAPGAAVPRNRPCSCRARADRVIACARHSRRGNAVLIALLGYVTQTVYRTSLRARASESSHGMPLTESWSATASARLVPVAFTTLVLLLAVGAASSSTSLGTARLTRPHRTDTAVASRPASRSRPTRSVKRRIVRWWRTP